MAREQSVEAPDVPVDTTLSEDNFFHYTKPMTFQPEEVAFVMVDLWNTGFGPEPLSHLGWEAEWNAGKSFCDRAGQIGTDLILPMLQACRNRGITVVHAPTADIAVKYPQWESLANDGDRQAATGSPSTTGTPPKTEWPPTEWTATWRTEHTHLFRTKRWISDYYKHVRPNPDIPEPLQPVDGDLVVTSGNMLHRLMAERQIRILFYCGFATNMCLIDKPGAIRDMYNRGYMPILVRDATAGTENAETYEGKWITHAFVDQIEMLWGYSILTDEFLKAIASDGDITVPCRYIRLFKPKEQQDSGP